VEGLSGRRILIRSDRSQDLRPNLSIASRSVVSAGDGQGTCHLLRIHRRTSVSPGRPFVRLLMGDSVSQRVACCGVSVRSMIPFASSRYDGWRCVKRASPRSLRPGCAKSLQRAIDPSPADRTFIINFAHPDDRAADREGGQRHTMLWLSSSRYRKREIIGDAS